MAKSSEDCSEELKYNIIELPSSVEIKESLICQGEPGAFCKVFIKKDTRFGPYKGEIVKAGQKADIDYRYAWEVFEKRSRVLRHTINAIDPDKGNWMRNVNSARFYEEQNILSVQEGFSIYYVAMKDIKPGEELLTWFDPKLLKRTQRRQSQTKRERRHIGYTIELVPWSDEKKFVPEIMETKRARKKKVMSDMISFDTDAPLVQRSLNRVLPRRKDTSSPSRRKKQSDDFDYLPGRSRMALSNTFSDVSQNSSHVHDSNKNIKSPPAPDTSDLKGSISVSFYDAGRHKEKCKIDTPESGNRTIHQKFVSRSPERSDPETKKSRPRMGNAVGNAHKFNTNRSRPVFIKPFDPSLLRPFVLRRKENGSTEIEDHDEIYTSNILFRSQCDDLCPCLNKSEMLSSKGAQVKSLGNTNDARKSLCIHFSLVPDTQNISSFNKIVFRCDICDSAYNHAFSLKRHYLKVHINHRYLSKNDIQDCQIETFHSGVDTDITAEINATKTKDGTMFQAITVKIPLLSELAQRKLSSKNLDKPDLSPEIELNKGCRGKHSSNARPETSSPEDKNLQKVKSDLEKSSESKVKNDSTANEGNQMENIDLVTADKNVDPQPTGKLADLVIKDSNVETPGDAKDQQNKTDNAQNSKILLKEKTSDENMGKNELDLRGGISDVQKIDSEEAFKCHKPEQDQHCVAKQISCEPCNNKQNVFLSQNGDQTANCDSKSIKKTSEVKKECLKIFNENQNNDQSESEKICEISDKSREAKKEENVLKEGEISVDNAKASVKIKNENGNHHEIKVNDSESEITSHLSEESRQLSNVSQQETDVNLKMDTNGPEHSSEMAKGYETSASSQSVERDMAKNKKGKDLETINTDVENKSENSEKYSEKYSNDSEYEMDLKASFGKESIDLMKDNLEGDNKDLKKEGKDLAKECEDLKKENKYFAKESEYLKQENEDVKKESKDLKNEMVENETQAAALVINATGKEGNLKELDHRESNSKDKTKAENDKCNGIDMMGPSSSNKVTETMSSHKAKPSLYNSIVTPSGESVSLVTMPLVSSPSSQSPDPKRPPVQQQVILLVPILSQTSTKPPSSKQPPISSSGSCLKSPTSLQSGMVATAPPGSISLIPSQSNVPMMVLSKLPSSTGVSAVPFSPSVLLQSSNSVQGFTTVAKMPGSESSITKFPGENISAFFVAQSVKGGISKTVCNDVSTVTTNLTPLPFIPANPTLLPATAHNSYMSTSYLSGCEEDKQPSDLYRCHMCVLVFKTMGELKHHIRNDPHRFKGGIKQYACVKCSLRFRNKHNLARHNLMHHRNTDEVEDRKFKCLTCGKGFTTENYLKMHARFHLGKSFPCKYGCQDVVFPNAATLVKHLRAVHPGLNLKEYIREKAMQERIKRYGLTSNGSLMDKPSYSMFHPGIGFQAKRGRPKGSKNLKKISLLSPPQQPTRVSDCHINIYPKELNILEQSQSLNDEENKANQKHFMFKCKLCSRSFRFHLKLLQHRSRVHGAFQSVQEFLFQMSKDTVDTSDSDHDTSSYQFSPPPSPKTFFSNVNSRGAENIQKYIDGGIETVKRYQQDELKYFTSDDDIKPLRKLDWPFYNFPLCFEYHDDPTSFYATVDEQPMISTEQTSLQISKTEDCLKKEDSVGEHFNDETHIFPKPYNNICAQILTGMPDSVTQLAKKSYFESVTSTDVGRGILDNRRDTRDKLSGSQITGNDEASELSSVNKGDERKLSVGKLEQNVEIKSSEGKEEKHIKMETQISDSQVLNGGGSLSSVSDSGFSSLSSQWSSVNEMEIDSGQLDLKTKSDYTENENVMSSLKILASKGQGNLFSDFQNLESKFNWLKGPAIIDYSATSLTFSALDLQVWKNVKESQANIKKMSSRIIQVLDLPASNSTKVIDKVHHRDLISEWKKRSSSGGRCQRSQDRSFSSILNISDSSKHDHRRYSIWSRQHSDKTDAKNDDAICCPVVVSVRKEKMMKEKSAWIENMKSKEAPTDGLKKTASRYTLNWKKKEAFANELGLMSKRDYQLSYHANEKESCHCIKPPEIWNVYDKIWFGKKGNITVICSICHRHFSCQNLCLRHQVKKHPHIEPHSLEIERDNYVDDMYYYYPMAYGILAHTQLIPDNMPSPEVYVCTRCTFPFKNLNRLHAHLTICDPSQGPGEPSANRSQSSHKKKKLLPMMDRRITQSTNSISSRSGSRKFLKQHNIPSSNSKSQTYPELYKKEYLSNSVKYISNRQEMKVEVKPSMAPSRFDEILSIRGRQRRKNYSLLYNPSNHSRRREMYQVLDQHQCHGCNLKFKSMSMLERHVKKCSGKDKLRSQKPLLSALTDDVALRKQHTCRYCNKRFTYIKGVDLHYKRICSVRKIKEEENQLTEEDLAHEAELQRIIEHMKWSKSLNKDSSDIILGRVRVEEDGTLIRVDKKRGRPFGKRKRMKKKGYRWTTLKRHRPDDNIESATQHSSVATDIKDGNETNTSISEESNSPSKNKEEIETEVRQPPRIEARKRKLSAQDDEFPKQVVKRKGRPPKIKNISNVTNKTDYLRPRRGRPRKRLLSSKSEARDKSQKQEEPESKLEAQCLSEEKCKAKEIEGLECKEKRNNYEDEAESAKPKRKRGRPKKYDPSDMPSSYRKRRKHELSDSSGAKKNTFGAKIIKTISSNADDTSVKNVNLSPQKISMKEKVTSESDNVSSSKKVDNAVRRKKSRAKAKEKAEKAATILETQLSTSSPQKQSDSPCESGKMKKDICTTDKATKSISILKTSESKLLPASNTGSPPTSPKQCTFIKISMVPSGTSPKETQSEIKEKESSCDSKEKFSQKFQLKEEPGKMKKFEEPAVSVELLKYLTNDLYGKLTTGDNIASDVPNVSAVSEAIKASGIQSKSCNENFEKNVSNKVNIPPKPVKIVSVVAGSPLLKAQTSQSNSTSIIKLMDGSESKEPKASPSEIKTDQIFSHSISSQCQTSWTTSSVSLTSPSTNSTAGVSLPSSIKSQAAHTLTPISVKVLSVSSGVSQLVSSPSAIKIIRSPPGSTSTPSVASSSPSSTNSSTHVANVVSYPFLTSTSTQMMGNQTKGKNPTSPSVVTGPRLGMAGKPVTVVHNPGIIQNVSLPSAVPLVTGANTQIPCVIRGGIPTTPNLRLPRIVSGNIRLSQALGTQLNSAIIVQPGAIRSNINRPSKTGVAMSPTSIRALQCRFGNPVSVRGMTPDPMQAGQRILKVANVLPAPKILPQGISTRITSPVPVHPIITSASSVGYQSQTPNGQNSLPHSHNVPCSDTTASSDQSETKNA